MKAAYHRWYHDTEWGTTVQDTYWLGSPLLKTPLDMWFYQEIMYQTRPTVIVETGTWRGGSTKHFGSMFDLIGEPNGRIMTVDIEKFPTPENPRVTYLIGFSTSPEILRQIRSLIHPEDKVMVSLDSNHSEEHVFEELRLFGRHGQVNTGRRRWTDGTGISDGSSGSIVLQPGGRERKSFPLGCQRTGGLCPAAAVPA